MPALKNAKHEAFAQGLAKGLSASEAYVAAGYKESRSAASRLSTNVNIEARVSELVGKGAERAEATVERVLHEMARLGFSDVRKAFTPGGALLPPQEWDDDFAAAVAAVEVVSRNTNEKDAEGRTVIEHVHKIKMWDKNSALEKIAKHLGMFVERVEHSGSMNLVVTPEDAEL
ncbi:terminase small subunit [Pelagibacterium sp. 26DY04]|uniref:terminase small subunit n=1 Tax=Pelagibacterium sp. 26DY04 TaxID=2967130 RepID=UPI0028165D55|nr:terminase small subunit [Pelagibacterium sp. 26DY04]WMT85580.1 terminase small subunit [Pelagibacterium sp. 26DY04]